MDQTGWGPVPSPKGSESKLLAVEPRAPLSFEHHAAARETSTLRAAATV
jgi:hypothetical protein